jgi:hypothetical protein
MITGGLVGFLIGLIFGLAEQSAWPSILWRASVGAVIAGLLLRWWGSIWFHCLSEASQPTSPRAEATAGPSPASCSVKT